MTTEATVATEVAKTTKKTVYNSVKMDDGRVVEFPGERKMLKSSGQAPDGKHYIAIDFSNGESRRFEIPESQVWKYACHGAEQKYGDETAQKGGMEVDDMVIAIDALAERLTTPPYDWGVKREAGEGFSGASVIIRAMCKVTGKGIEFIKSYLEKKLADTNAPYLAKGEKAVLSRQGLYKSIRASDKFGPTIAAMEAEKTSKGPKVEFEDISESEEATA